MSTKATIRHGPSFHLYSDVLEELDDSDTPAAFVYLVLDGVQVQLDTSPDSGPSVTLRLPRELALRLGLLAHTYAPRAMPIKPARSTNGDAFAERVRREYGRRLLDQLPHVPPSSCCGGALIEGYRRVQAASERVVQRVHETDTKLVTTRAAFERDAHSIHAVLEVVRCHLIACELSELVERFGDHDLLELVLVAELRVAELAGDVGEGT